MNPSAVSKKNKTKKKNQIPKYIDRKNTKTNKNNREQNVTKLHIFDNIDQMQLQLNLQCE